MPRQPVIEVDLVSTRRRIARLRRYVNTHLLAPDRAFICPKHRDCRRSTRPGDTFREGTMSYVGHRYDLRRNGRPLRIVVVGQESGWARTPGGRGGRRVSMDDRYTTIHDRSGIERGYYARDGRQPRNPHMRGTTSALRLILGKGLGADHDDEYVQPVVGRPFHIFDGFALVNRLLCSAGPPQSSQGRSTTTMRSNCAEHFDATLRILEPTLVVLQGDAVRRWTDDILVPNRHVTDNLYVARHDARPVTVAAFTHPAAHGAGRWGDRLDSPYLLDVVRPTLRRAVGLS